MSTAACRDAVSTRILTVSVCVELHWVSVRRRPRLRLTWDLRQRMLPPPPPLHGSARHHQLHRLLLTDALLHDDTQVWKYENIKDKIWSVNYFCYKAAALVASWCICTVDMTETQTYVNVITCTGTRSLTCWSPNPSTPPSSTISSYRPPQTKQFTS